MPFPDKHTFMTALLAREDRRNPEFAALVASMLAALAVWFPRTTYTMLKTQARRASLSDAGAVGAASTSAAAAAILVAEWSRPAVFAAKCRDLALVARGPRWVLRQAKTFEHAMTSFLLAVTSESLGDSVTSRLLMAETVGIVKETERADRAVALPTSAIPRPHYNNDQVRRRIFWAVVRHTR